MTATRWGLRLLGLINTAILARLLAPADFGLLAMAMIVVSFIEIWFLAGLTLRLFKQERNPRRFQFCLDITHYAGCVSLPGYGCIVESGGKGFFNEPSCNHSLAVLAPAILTAAEQYRH